MTDHHDQQARELLAEACGASSFLDLGIAVSVTQALRAIAAALRMGATTFTNDGDSEAQFIADGERLNCPACGGSGHVDDPKPVAVAEPEYDRELIARMLEAYNYDGGPTHTSEAIQSQIDALRAADNRSVDGAGTVNRTEAVAEIEAVASVVEEHGKKYLDFPAGIIQTARRLPVGTKLYTAPQPATPEGMMAVQTLDLESLREHLVNINDDEDGDYYLNESADALDLIDALLAASAKAQGGE